MAGGSGAGRFLYVFDVKGDGFKIGRAEVIGKRFYRMFFGRGNKFSDERLGTGQPRRVVLTIEAEPDQVSAAEHLAHSILRLKYGGIGETFPCSECEAVGAAQLAMTFVRNGHGTFTRNQLNYALGSRNKQES